MDTTSWTKRKLSTLVCRRSDCVPAISGNSLPIHTCSYSSVARFRSPITQYHAVIDHRSQAIAWTCTSTLKADPLLTRLVSISSINYSHCRRRQVFFEITPQIAAGRRRPITTHRSSASHLPIDNNCRLAPRTAAKRKSRERSRGSQSPGLGRDRSARYFTRSTTVCNTITPLAQVSLITSTRGSRAPSFRTETSRGELVRQLLGCRQMLRKILLCL